MNVEIGAEAAQFPEKEYVKGIAVAVYMSDRLERRRVRAVSLAVYSCAHAWNPIKLCWSNSYSEI